MKTILPNLMILSVLSWTAPTFAQTFDAGSDGSDGALNVTADTEVPLPDDGILNYTTINVAAGAILTFTPNALNTAVHLLATGDVTIDGEINVDSPPRSASAPAPGGPGGFGGGIARQGGSAQAGRGQGPGGGEGGTASVFPGRAGHIIKPTAASTGNGEAYGNLLLMPLIGGSGSGGGGLHGGGGGGAVCIASNSQIECNGEISAQGAAFGGSGGAIRLIAPVVTGSGVIRLTGRDGASPGRLRIDALDNQSTFNMSPTNSGNSTGKFMAVFPPVTPTLSIVEAAGTAIAENNPQPVAVTLPAGSNPTQTITVRARDFAAAMIPIRVVLAPDQGPSSSVDATIDATGGSPAEAEVTVTFPLNIPTRVELYTR